MPQVKSRPAHSGETSGAANTQINNGSGSSASHPWTAPHSKTALAVSVNAGFGNPHADPDCCGQLKQ